MRRLVTLLVGLCIISAPSGRPHQPAPRNSARRMPQRLAGTVQDSLGRPVAGAKVSLQSAAGKVVAKTATDAQGHFSFARVNPGTYAVMATKQSFKPAIKIAAVGAWKASRS